MTPDVIKVRPLDDFWLELTFEAEDVRRFDVKPYRHDLAFMPLTTGDLFCKGHVENGTVARNDDMDLAPETLCGSMASRWIKPSPRRPPSRPERTARRHLRTGA